MSKINQVRQTVLSILNKNNYGYISPIDFNLFAKQAQLDLFEQYFYDFNKQITAENMRLSGTGHADINRQLQEVIDTFSQFKALTLAPGSNQTFDLPDDWYTFVEVIWGQSCEAPGTSYSDKEAERVSEYDIRRLNRSELTKPSPQFPAYVFSQQGQPTTEGSGVANYGNLSNQITLYPAPEPASVCTLLCNLSYIRYPKQPNWTSSLSLSDGIALFDDTNQYYVDFELPESDIPNLINKILQYSGMSIREIAAMQFGQIEEQKDNAGEDPIPKTKSSK